MRQLNRFWPLQQAGKHVSLSGHLGQVILHGSQGPGQVLDNASGRRARFSRCVVGLLDVGRLRLVENAPDGLQGHTGLDQPADLGEPGDMAQVVVTPAAPFSGNWKQTQRVVVAHRAHGCPGQLGDLGNAHEDSLTRHPDPDPFGSASWGRIMGSAIRLPGHVLVATVPA